MKEADVTVDYKKHQMVLYAEKSDHSYGPVVSGSYMAKNYVDVYWGERRKLEIEYLQKIRDGLVSPLAYYLELVEMAPAELAARAGVTAGDVKRHLQPKYFNQIDLALLGRYAQALGIPAANLLQIVVPKSANIKINHQRTDNPLASIAEVDEGHNEHYSFRA